MALRSDADGGEAQIILSIIEKNVVFAADIAILLNVPGKLQRPSIDGLQKFFASCSWKNNPKRNCPTWLFNVSFFQPPEFSKPLKN